MAKLSNLNALLLLSTLTLLMVACGPEATPQLVQASTPPSNTPQAEPRPVEETPSGRPTPVSTLQTGPLKQDALALVHDGDLWLELLPDGVETRLAHFGDVADAHFSPDGQLVLFERQGESMATAGEPGVEIRRRTWWVAATSGGEPYQVLDAVGLPSQARKDTLTAVPSMPDAWIWLPDGHTLLFTTKGIVDDTPNEDLWRLDLQTGQLETLLPAGQGGRPTLSPDGRMLLLSTQNQIAVSKVDGSGRRALLSFDPLFAYMDIPRPQWDGTSLARVAVVQRASQGRVTSALWLLHPATVQRAEELGRLETSQSPDVLWSPDGTRLAYRDGGLFLADADGQNARRIDGTQDALPLAWSPAGRWLAVKWGHLVCAVEDVEGATPTCLHETEETRVFWQDEQRLVFVRTSPWDAASLIWAQLPNVIRSGLPIGGAQLQAYDFYLSPSRSSRLVVPTPTAVPESIARWQHYDNPALGFAVDVPANWQIAGPEAVMDAPGRALSRLWFRSDLLVSGQQSRCGNYAIMVEVGDSEGRTLTETLAYSLVPYVYRDSVSSHCCLTVGGEPALEVFGWPMAEWDDRRLIIIHEGWEYHIDLFPQSWLDSDIPEDKLARAAFDVFLRTFTFVPISAAPVLTPTNAAVPTRTSEP